MLQPHLKALPIELFGVRRSLTLDDNQSRHGDDGVVPAKAIV